jgi:uncharacterized membrane protein YfcA
MNWWENFSMFIPSFFFFCFFFCERAALWYGFIGFVGGFIGQELVERMIKKYGRPSLVIFLLAFVIALSCVVLTIMGLIDVSNTIKDKNYSSFGFTPLC